MMMMWVESGTSGVEKDVVVEVFVFKHDHLFQHKIKPTLVGY